MEGGALHISVGPIRRRRRPRERWLLLFCRNLHQPQPVPDFPSSSSSESVVPLPKRRSSAQGEAPVTPPKAAPVKSAPATPKLVPQPKTKKATGKAAPEPKQPPAAKSSRSSRAALEVTESGFVVERPASIPADEDFKMTTMPATLNPPMEEVIWDRLATV